MTHLNTGAWSLVRAAAQSTCGGWQPHNGDRYKFDGETLTPAVAHEPAVLGFDEGWHSLLAAGDERQVYLDLYLPLIRSRPGAPIVIAQLGQSLDGFIATATGHSHFVTGPASIVHLHCLRALSDCVIVGAGTVANDDPRLTTRLVEGPNPVRVVLDPRLRLPITHVVFSDGAAPTLRVRARGVPLSSALRSPTIEDIEVDATDGKLDLRALTMELGSRGLRTLLIEGGGVTVSHFLTAQLVDRMHIVVAPFVIGEGRPGLRVPSPERLEGCVRPPPRVYTLGSDVLFDCDLRSQAAGENDRGFIRRVL